MDKTQFLINWVGSELSFFVCGEIGKVFHNPVDIEGLCMRNMSLFLVKGLVEIS